MNARANCTETCFIDGNLYEKGQEVTLDLPDDHGHWEYFDVIEDYSSPKPKKGKPEAAPVE